MHDSDEQQRDRFGGVHSVSDSALTLTGTKRWSVLNGIPIYACFVFPYSLVTKTAIN
jgi:hypothetical protein